MSAGRSLLRFLADGIVPTLRIYAFALATVVVCRALGAGMLITMSAMVLVSVATFIYNDDHTLNLLIRYLMGRERRRRR